jgi:hypothetical protein
MPNWARLEYRNQGLHRLRGARSARHRPQSGAALLSGARASPSVVRITRFSTAFHPRIQDSDVVFGKSGIVGEMIETGVGMPSADNGMVPIPVC